MTDKEVLQKAIENAKENGYGFEEKFRCSYLGGSFEWVVDNGWEHKIIFSHDFAKAFWNEEGTMNVSSPKHGIIQVHVWMMHLQQMVLYPNPIDYLRQFIDNTEKPESK